MQRQGKNKNKTQLEIKHNWKLNIVGISKEKME